jgi:hypothetical protein
MLLVKNVLDDGELGANGRGVGGSPVAFESSENLQSIFGLSLADQETRRIREEWAESVDAEREDYVTGQRSMLSQRRSRHWRRTDLKCQWEPPCNASREEGKSKREPIGDGETGDAVRLVRVSYIFT